MKKLFFTFLTIFTVCSFFACQHKEQQQTENHILGLTKQQKKEQKTTFAIETVKDSVSKKVGKIVCTSTINIDFPIKGNPYLLNSIREWIIDWTYANDTIPIDDYHAIMKDYNANSMKEMADIPSDPNFERFGSSKYTIAMVDEVSEISEKAVEVLFYVLIRRNC